MNSTNRANEIKNCITPSLHSNTKTVNMSRVREILAKLNPITTCFKDSQGRAIQVWRYGEKSFVGSVLDPNGKLDLVPISKIINSLCRTPVNSEFLQNLSSQSLRDWDFVYDAKTSSLEIWPHMRAEGRYKHDVYSDDHFSRVNPFKNMNEQKATERLDRHPRLERKDIDKNDGTRITQWQSKEKVNVGGRLVPKHILTVDRRGEGKYPNEPTHLDYTCNSGPRAGKYRLLLKEDGPPDAPGGNKGPDGSGGPKDPGEKQFQQTLQQNNLTDSFNNTHQHNPVPAKGGTGGEIGGVACSTDYIEGLFDSPEAIFDKEHYFVLPGIAGERLPFSNGELQQILRELAIGIYVHSTVPFFSLHFNQATDLFPVIHPAYKDTLIGRVIGMLDYIMKGYLNGGVFEEEFIDNWYKDPNWARKESSSLQKLINFEEYCRENLEGIDKRYQSLRERSALTIGDFALPAALEALEGMLGTGIRVEESDQLKNFDGFTNSFRIIAKQKSVQKHDNLFYIDADFDVFYTIEPSPAYQQALEQYTRKNGAAPQSYQKLVMSFEFMKKRIHDHMVKFPLCKEYFSMLSVINFFSGYFSTLKKHRKFPVLPAIARTAIQGCPVLFPHLPINSPAREMISLNPKQVLDVFKRNPSSSLHTYLSRLLDHVKEERSIGRLETAALLEKERVLEEYQREIANNIVSFVSPTLRRYFDHDREKLEAISRKIALQLVRLLVDRFRTVITPVINQGNLHWLQQNPIVIAQIIDIFSHVDRKIEIMSFPYQTPRVTTEMSLQEIEEGKKIVGGCGMHLEETKIIPSISAQTVLRNNWFKLLTLVPENWVRLAGSSTGEPTTYGFRLVHEDTPPFFCDDFTWMESAFFGLERESEFLSDMKEAMTRKNKNWFEQLVNGENHLSSLADYCHKSPLHYAALEPDPFYINVLLRKGMSPDRKDRLGYLPIHYAAMGGSIQVIEVLLDHSSNSINAENHSKATPLIVALQHKQKEVVKLLISKEASLTAGVEGYTALHVALHEGDLETIDMVLKHRSIGDVINCLSEVGGTPLMLACELGNTQLVQKMMELGADPAIVRKDGMTAIEIAVLHNFHEILKALLQRTQPEKHAIEAATCSGDRETIQLIEKTPLFYSYKNDCEDTVLIQALLHGNVEAAIYVIDKTNDLAFLNAKNIDGQSAFIISSKLSFWDVIQKLDSKGVDLDLVSLLHAQYHPHLNTIFSRQRLSSEELQNLLLVAAKVGNYQAISQVLMKSGARPTQLTSLNGWGVLHYLARAGGVFLFKQLFDGANLLDRLPPSEGRKTLPFIAAENGSVSILEFLLVKMKQQQTSLERHHNDMHLFAAAIQSGKTESVAMMLRYFEDQHLENVILDQQSTRPVHLAAKKGHLEILMLLKEKNANLNETDINRCNCLHYAIRLGDANMVTFLLENNTTITSRSLYDAAVIGPEIFELVISKCNLSQQLLDASLLLSINKRNMAAFLVLCQAGASLSGIAEDGWTPLLRACYIGQQEMVLKILYDAGLDSRMVQGNNSLHWAVINGHAHIVKMLLSAGFSPDMQNAEGKTPLQLATEKNFKNTKNILEGRDPSATIDAFWQAIQSGEAQDIENRFNALPLNETIFIPEKNMFATPLQWLIKSGMMKVCPEFIRRTLLSSTLKKEICDSEGNTLAHLLAERGDEQTTIPGIVLNSKNYKGQTPLHIASMHAGPSQLDLLLRTLPESDREPQDHQGKTPLFYAIEGQKKENIVLLINHGANVNHYTNELATPLMLTIVTASLDQVKLLLDKGASPNQTVTSKKLNLLELAAMATNRFPEIISLLLHGANCDMLDGEKKHLSHRAAELGNIRLLRLLAAKGKLKNIPDLSGMHPIHVMGSQDSANVIANLLKDDENLVEQPVEIGNESKNRMLQGATPLHIAMLRGNMEAAEKLLELHANPATKSECGLNALSFAAMSQASKGMLNIMYRYRLSNDPGELLRASFAAISLDNLEAVISIYRKGVSIDAELPGMGSGLHIASRRGALMSTQWLLQEGGNPEHPSPSGDNAFELAAVNDSYEQFRLLMEFTNRDPNAVNQKGESLLHLACKAGRLHHVIYLLLKKADINKGDNKGFTPLHNAAKEGHESIVSLLIGCGADTSKAAAEGQLAGELANKENVRKLFTAFVAISHRTHPSDTRLHNAVRWGNQHALLLLCQIDDINKQNSIGKTALHIAVDQNSTNSVLCLLREGADPKIKDSLNKKPSDYVENPQLISIFNQYQEVS